MPSLKCPICKKPVDPKSEDAPFCSDRCRTIDLGKWASDEYKISSPVLDPDLLDELDAAGQANNPFADADNKQWKN